MTNEEAKHKMDFLKKSYQKLIDEKVDSGKLVGDGVMGEWKAETPLDEAYKSMIEALDLAINALEQQPCEDCISRQYLIERATSWDKHFADSERCVSLTEIQNAPSVTPNARWIPCSDKMPDINIHVLAQFVMGGMAECYYAHNWWHIVGGFRISGDEVIAWQPLPELYKAESEE